MSLAVLTPSSGPGQSGHLSAFPSLKKEKDDEKDEKDEEPSNLTCEVLICIDVLP